MDYPTLAVMAKTADGALRDARLRKVIGQGSKELVLCFDLAGNGKETGIFGNWLLSADPDLYRIHPVENDQIRKHESSHFPDVCSHHLTGARVENVKIADFERIIRLKFSRRDYSGEVFVYAIVAEFMGKHSNLILLDSGENIIASMKTVHSYQSRAREIRAGGTYRLPPSQDRIAPKEFTRDEWAEFLSSGNPHDSIGDHLGRTFRGMSPGWASLICTKSELNPETSVGEIAANQGGKLLETFVESLRLARDGKPVDGSDAGEFILKVAHEYAQRFGEKEFISAREKLGSVINKRHKKILKLHRILEQELEKSSKAEEYRKRADLLQANRHLAEPGADTIVADDWENGVKNEIRLEPGIPIQRQIENLYRKYRKLKRTREMASHRFRAVQTEMHELQDLLSRLGSAKNPDDLEIIREECIFSGLIEHPEIKAPGRRKGAGGKKVSSRMEQMPAARRYHSNDGFLILAGTSDKSNDALRRYAGPEDVWLHVRDVAGSHVFIITRGRELPETTLLEAAMVAAWNSKAREGSKVPVDYTRVKYLTPIPGSGPGKVTFRRERTIRVTPDENRIKMMSMMSGDVDD